MTLPRFEKRTAAFEEDRDQPATSEFVSSGARPLDGSADAVPSGPAESNDLPADLHRALRAARTPLIEGVDFKHPDSHRNAVLPQNTTAESLLVEKSRVDTLSPLEAVPPQAPYPSEPPPARPSVVPPVRLPYNDPISPRTRSDPPPRGIRSDPPPRISISDRPSKPAYRSEAPPRMARSDPPPASSGRGPASYRRSWGDAEPSLPDPILLASPEARRREAVTIQADAHAASQLHPYDPSLPLPALRAPSFSVDQLPLSIRQHENSRLRNVAMTMMFVIFIVIGAVAGMRWYVTRDESVTPARNANSSDRPRVSRTRLDRPEPNAVVAPHVAAEPADGSPPLPNLPPAPARSASLAQPTSKGGVAPNAAAADKSGDPTAVRSPWDSNDGPSSAQDASARQPIRASSSKTRTAPTSSPRKSRTKSLGPNQVDTKSPLIAD